MSLVYKSLLRAGRDTRQICNITKKSLSFYSLKCVMVPEKHLQRINFHRPLSYQFYCNIKFSQCRYYSSSKVYDEDECLTEDKVDSYEEANFHECFDPANNRLLLYPESSDEIILKLNQCSSVQSVFNILKDDSANLERNHLCQAILVLSDLQKAYDKSYLDNLVRQDIVSSPEKMLDEYATEIKCHEEFTALLQRLYDQRHTLDTKELSFLLVYFKKMGLTLNHYIMSDLQDITYQLLKDTNEDWSLQSLTRYSHFLDAGNSMQYVMMAKDIIPRVLQYMKTCNSADDFKLITIALHNIHILVTLGILDQYKTAAKRLMNEKVLTKDSYSTLLRMMTFLNLPHWSNTNSEEISSMCHLLKDSISEMDANEIVILHRVFQSHLEPASMKNLICDRVTHLLEKAKMDDRIATYMRLPDLLNCQITISSPQSRLYFEKLTESLVESAYPSLLMSVYKVLRHLKSSNHRLIDKFWTQLLEHIKDSDDYIHLQTCHKYLYFSGGFQQKYYNNTFETTMINTLIDMINNGIIGFVPWKFSRSIAFFLAYGFNDYQNSMDINVMNRYIDRLENMMSQLDHLDCLIISKGIQESSKYYRKRHRKQWVSQLLLRVNTILDECASNHLKSKDINVSNLNIIFKTYVNRKAALDTEQFHVLIQKMNGIKTSDLSSRFLRDAAFNMLTVSIIVPKVFDSLIDYIVLKDNDVLGETAYKVLYMCYFNGYVPKNDDFYQIAINVTERDKDTMTGLSLLNTCTALCYYGCLSDTLVKYIFSIEFMERVDLEIASCYAKMTYPARVRKQLMQLNRAVCLDTPQHQVPWFHEKYTQEMKAFTQNKMSIFQEDVYNILKIVLGSNKSIEHSHFSPYGYKVDFLLNLENDGQHTKANSVNEDPKKIAVLLFEKSSFSKLFTDVSHASGQVDSQIKFVLNGPAQEMMRHLELMGYQIIQISSFLWNSMHMAEPEAKIDFIRKQIWN